jgi:hypothetical protein
MTARLRQPAGQACGTCAHFEGDPSRLEILLPGLTILGSARGSVGADDGLCLLHDTMRSGRSCCRDHAREIDIST